ncbi:von Willebrand factor A domain-containing protein 7-like [Periophthalmus magnuspinnatus]|uniref:von Willebrand factor A domain-containing protein 7-like n=1 Tax=Periophthalmus magnuspinnatus TaxID=409849 RepID=UPI00145A175D|nr:von Willebrand factor A domain-containing protein 7-like [Periophthalmus magnuspinnatus]
MSGLFLLTLMSLLSGVTAFKIIKSPLWSHQEITERAILNVTTHACRAVAEAEGLDFTFPASFTIEMVAEACAAREAAKSFGKNIRTIKDKNAAVDVKLLSSRRHFDDETFKEGKKLITDGLDAVKSSIKKDNMKFARSKIGEILHTLQDFYSHSNWIEMGNDKPNSNVTSKLDSIGKIADKKRPTCRNCDGDDCTNNILEDILEEKLLTSGYFSLIPFKPSGKCSHGNFPDASALRTPKGGINKDSLTSSHGHLHNQAATVAVDATFELLNDVRSAAGDKEFLRMLGLIPGRPLCFVIDTTGSMRDDIAAVKEVTSEIINKRVGTKNEPSLYILVPFNDPDFGPLMRTTDANEFKKAINALTPNGGGDSPEMSLSGLLLGLTGAPLDSEIYLFTDAAAKDSHLKSTVAALIEKTGSVVNFMITSFSSLRRRRSNSGNQQQIAPRMAVTEFQVYKDLAAASGGQSVEVSKKQLLEAINVVLETSTSSVVTLVVRNSRKSENVTFTVDERLTDLTIYITGTNKDFILISPTGVAQESTTTNGSLFTSVVVGNLQALMLKTEGGLWEIRMVSTNPYSLKITAKSPIDFFFSFMQPIEGPFEGYIAIENRPKAGANGTMMVKLIGSDMANVTEVYLVYSSGSGKVKGTVSSQGNGEYLVQFDTIPSEEFTVVVKGQNGKISSKSIQPATFQRQSSTSIKPSSVSVTIDDENDIIEPGATLSMNFTVSSNGSGGTFSIRATNDQSFSLSFPQTLEVVSGSSTVGTLQLSVPTDAESGTEVTLTVEAEAPDGDVNYGVLMVTVLKEVTDVTRPVCELLSLQDNCTETCGNSTWQLSVRLSDGVNGTGIVRVYHRQGNGTLNTTVDANDTVASYEASCCSPTVEIIVVDAVGNVGSCSFTTRVASSAMTTAKPTDAPTTTPNSSTTVGALSVAPKVNQSFLLCFFITLLAVQHK